MFDVELLALEDGSSPFERWFARLPAAVADRVDTAVERMRRGNLGDHKAVGEGVHEHRIHHGPGYRIYFGRDGRTLIVLIGGGTKKGQARDIQVAKRLWKELQAPQAEVLMGALTREFKEMVVRRAERDPEFRREMLKTGVELLLTGDPEDAAIGREKLRTYINATIGFERLAAELGKSPKSLMRMFSASGNPSLSNLSSVIGELQRAEGVRLEVEEAS